MSFWQIFTYNWLACADDTGMFYGMKYYNDLLMEAGPFGNVQSEVLLRKDKNTFTLKEGWGFPRKVYFNGDECKMPPPDAYPYLPNSAYVNLVAFSTMAAPLVLMLLTIWWSVLYGGKLYSSYLFVTDIANTVLKARTIFYNRYIYIFVKSGIQARK